MKRLLLVFLLGCQGPAGLDKTPDVPDARILAKCADFCYLGESYYQCYYDPWQHRTTCICHYSRDGATYDLECLP